MLTFCGGGAVCRATWGAASCCCFSSNCRICRISFRIASACSLFMPSGMLMVTEPAWTLFASVFASGLFLVPSFVALLCWAAAAAADTQAKAVMHSIVTEFFIRRVLMAPASVIIVVLDNDSRPNERDRDMDAIRERIQNVIQIVALEVDVFRAL